jgi:hypothetical protein
MARAECPRPMRYGENHIQHRRQARRDRGQDSDEETNNSKEEDDPPAPEVPLELQEGDNAIAMFVRMLLFSRGAATALYDDQKVLTTT